LSFPSCFIFVDTREQTTEARLAASSADLLPVLIGHRPKAFPTIVQARSASPVRSSIEANAKSM